MSWEHWRWPGRPRVAVRAVSREDRRSISAQCATATRGGVSLMEMGGGDGGARDVVDAALPSGAVVRVRVVEGPDGFEEVGRLAPADLEEAFGAIEEVAGV